MLPWTPVPLLRKRLDGRTPAWPANPHHGAPSPVRPLLSTVPSPTPCVPALLPCLANIQILPQNTLPPKKGQRPTFAACAVGTFSQQPPPVGRPQPSSVPHQLLSAPKVLPQSRAGALSAVCFLREQGDIRAPEQTWLDSGLCSLGARPGPGPTLGWRRWFRFFSSLFKKHVYCVRLIKYHKAKSMPPQPPPGDTGDPRAFAAPWRPWGQCRAGPGPFSCPWLPSRDGSESTVGRTGSVGT